MSAPFNQVELQNVPSGLPVNPNKKRKEELELLKNHIDATNLFFRKYDPGNDWITSKSSKRLKLSQYQVDKSLFGFVVGEFEVRDHANFLCLNFYEKCISNPISNLEDQILTQEGIDKTLLMRNIKTLAYQLGRLQIIYQAIYFSLFIGIIVSDILQVIYQATPDFNGNDASYFIYSRICLIFILYITQLIYIYKANRCAFYSSYFLMIFITVISILCLTGYNLFTESIAIMFWHLIEIAIILLMCLAQSLHIYKLEMNLQRMRVLLGARYQSPIICCI